MFGTDVMVTVAKNIDGPIKLLFPRSLEPNEETGKIKQGMHYKIEYTLSVNIRRSKSENEQIIFPEQKHVIWLRTDAIHTEYLQRKSRENRVFVFITKTRRTISSDSSCS